MNHVSVAALIRGLCIDLTGKPQFVVYQKCDSAVGMPGHSAIGVALEIGQGENEESSAAIIRKAYGDWKMSIAPGEISENEVIVPPCMSLCVNGKPEALYWIDGNIDSARKRRDEKNTTFRVESTVKPGAVITTEERASVVKNRVTLVTGGAQGIGEEIVRNLAAAGAFVFIADLNLEGASKLADKISAEEGRTAALAIKVDVCDEASVEAMFNTAVELTGGLDLCVSNAGVLKAGSVLEQNISDFKFVTDINYTGFFIISKFAGRLLRTQHLTAPSYKTDIIQVNSKSGLEGSNKNGAYAGGKFGGIGLVASFAMELVEYGIKVNAVCPGNFLDGPLWSDPDKGLFVQYLKTGKVPGAKTVNDVRASYESKVPMGRGCTGKDLVRAILYIVEQQYETGQAVPVTGGQIMLH
jgi:sorbitol-6-phosphate 2-dehydrogenase